MASVSDDTTIIHSQPCWTLDNDDIQVAVTRLGGHMAPVTFDRRSPRPIRPYFISPWQDEGHESFPAAVLTPLRGDFFCLPFGGNGEPEDGRRHEPHGETATGNWSFDGRDRLADGTQRLSLSLETRVRPGHVLKELTLRPGQPAVYIRHHVEGFVGPAPVGHHATLSMPDREGAILVSTSPFHIGMTNPGLFSDPISREYQFLAVGEPFDDLTRVPTLFRQPTVADCTRFPTRRGYADLLAIVADSSRLEGCPAWTAAVDTDEGWCWFSLRDPQVLPTTLFWIENRGRHGFPWNGRNNCLGLEDVCAAFADGIAASRQSNPLSALGVPTTIAFNADQPKDFRSIQGAIRIPSGFDLVATIRFERDGIVLVARSGSTVTVPIDWRFALSNDRDRSSDAPARSIQ